MKLYNNNKKGVRHLNKKDNKSVFATLGASNHSENEREKNDYYATPPIATEELLKVEKFSSNVFECCCGEGHISKVLKDSGYKVYSSDLIDRGYGDVEDFFFINEWNGDIVTNPPYKIAEEVVRHAIKIIPEGNKVAMLLKITFLEGQKRAKLFKEYPPKRIYVFSKRVTCAKNGDFVNQNSGALAYAWFIWEKGSNTLPVIDWVNI